jgi:hypothetical protein
MNKAAFIVYVGVFLALPPALLLTRLFDKARMPWVLLLAVSVVVGWMLVNLAHMFYINDQLVQMSAYSVPAQTPGYRSNDFMFTFGWLFGPVYLLPWVFLYCVFLFARWMLTSRGA